MHGTPIEAEQKANLPNRYSALCWRPVWRMRRHGPVIAHYRFGRLSEQK